MNFVKPKTVVKVIPPDIYNAVCVGVWDLGLQQATGLYAGKPPSPKVLIGWELQTGDFVSKEYTRQIDEWVEKTTKAIKKTKLKEHLELWFSPHKITDPSTFDANLLLGKRCRLVISQSASGYPRVDSVTKPDANAEKWEPTRSPMYFEIGDEIPEGTENWIANRIDARVKEAPAGEEPQNHPQEVSQVPTDGSVPF